jgi:hypothetical protein
MAAILHRFGREIHAGLKGLDLTLRAQKNFTLLQLMSCCRGCSWQASITALEVRVASLELRRWTSQRLGLPVAGSH